MNRNSTASPIASLLPCMLLAPLLIGCTEAAVASAHVEDLPQLGLTEMVRIGSVDDPDVGFSSIAAVAVDEGGLVYVLERQEHEVRVYDESGALLHSMGREGEGPGEFVFPSAIGIVGDTVWVADPRQQRVSLFTRAGEFLNSYNPTPTQLDLGPGINVTLVAGGLDRQGGLTSTWMIMIPRDPPTDTVMVPVVRMDTTGTITDTLRYIPWAFPPQASVTVGGRELPVPGAPTSSPLHTTAHDGGVFIVDRDLATSEDDGVFTVRRFSEAGDTLYSRALHYRPRGYEGAVTDSLIARYTSLFEAMNIDEDAATSAMRDAMVLPPFQPPVSSAEAGTDGSLWLRRDDDGSALAHWIILNPDGTPEGTLALPRRATVHWVDGDIVWVSEPDDLDVPWLVKYRVGPAGA